MRLKCNCCSKAVSTEVPDGTVVRAHIECPECIKNRSNGFIVGYKAGVKKPLDCVGINSTKKKGKTNA